ncbi:hypothetical protein BKA60DRAFT_548613 [Fusarium oxysporum]|nr:hypothetical protein BKA60DRAFT_548613 [Fusarium oxysporum]
MAQSLTGYLYSATEALMKQIKAQRMENNATRTTPRLAEPSLVWDPLTAKCNTKTVLQQLGATTSEIPITQRRTFHFAPPLRRKQPNSLVTGDSMETNDGIYSADWDPLYAGWSAFISGLVVIVTHLILVLLVILMSRLCGVPGRFQNVWASISQLLGSVTEDWIREADTVDDKTVEW